MTYYNNNIVEKEEIQLALNNIIYVNISNVCSRFNVKTHLNLRHIALKGHNVEYRHSQKRLIMRLRKPTVTANISSNGTIFCMGTPSEYEAKIAARRIARIIQKLGYNSVKLINYEITNVLGSCQLPFKIRIIPFAQKYRPNAEYEPELQEGVIYKTKELKATISVHWTGKIVVNARSEATVIRAIEHIYPLVLPFRRSKLLEDVLSLARKNQAFTQNLKVKKPNENHRM